MKITIVQGAFFPVPPLMGGAVEKVWWALGAEFARRGHQVTHVSRQHPDLAVKEVVQGVEHRRVPGFDAPHSLLRLKLLDLVYSLRALRALPAADVLVTNTFWLPILIRSRRFGRLYVHVARYPKGQMKFYRHAARLQTVTSAIAEAIGQELPGLASKVTVVPYPHDSRAALDDASAERSRDKHLLYVGRVHPEKGLELLLEAFGRLPSPQFDEWKLIVVGPAEAKLGGGGESFLARLQQLAEPFRQRVVWEGPEFDRGKLGAHYARAAVFVYPSLAERGETFGLAPLEAMAAGCAPLVSDLACFRDFIVDEDTGCVFDHRCADPAATLAQKLAAILGDPVATAAMGARAQRRSRDFQLAAVATQYLADFEALDQTA